MNLISVATIQLSYCLVRIYHVFLVLDLIYYYICIVLNGLALVNYKVQFRYMESSDS
jgi:hypothetical protein